jgi:carbon monoxide dehydrogenase subunit G
VQMQHHFTVPVPIDVAWPALLDLERVAPCMPGATLTKADGNEFAGSVKVRLGPISLLYKGNGSFTDIDADARRVVIDASGKDSRGNGTASATVTAVLAPQGDSTSVQVDTDLKVTGKPAQLGRGMISEVGGKIIDQFAQCLAERLAGPEPEETAESVVAEGVNGDGPAAARATLPSPQATSASKEGAASWPSAADDAIDLLGTAGVPVLKRLAPVAGGLLFLFIVLRLLRKRRR